MPAAQLLAPSKRGSWRLPGALEQPGVLCRSSSERILAGRRKRAKQKRIGGKRNPEVWAKKEEEEKGEVIWSETGMGIVPYCPRS